MYTAPFLSSKPVSDQNKDSAHVINFDSAEGIFILTCGYPSYRTDEKFMSGTNGQVLEFKLGEETYCVSIAYVTEIVDIGTVTTVPNAPDHVEGVVDLRGRTTSIVNPKVIFGIDGEGAEQRVVVFDPGIFTDHAAAGWLVDEVYQVVQITPEQVDASPTGSGNGSIRGVIKRDDGFVIWVDPAAVHAS